MGTCGDVGSGGDFWWDFGTATKRVADGVVVGDFFF